MDGIDYGFPIGNRSAQPLSNTGFVVLDCAAARAFFTNSAPQVPAYRSVFRLPGPSIARRAEAFRPAHHRLASCENQFKRRFYNEFTFQGINEISAMPPIQMPESRKISPLLAAVGTATRAGGRGINKQTSRAARPH